MNKPSENSAARDGQKDAGTQKKSTVNRSAVYLASALAITVSTLGLLVQANRQYAPEMYRAEYMETVADAFESGENYAVFDLNINIRKLREEQWKRLDGKPSVLVLGASQWQEASADLMPNRNYLNGHVHRDYYEDVLGMVELLVRHDKLPRDLVITIRDRLFTPVAERTDFLWLPGIPYYQAMAKRLSLPQLSLVESYPLQRPRELLSLSMLFGNATRWHSAKEWPSPTSHKRHAALDVLHPDGSISWSEEHLALFTQDRARKLAIAHADANRMKPPVIDPKGVQAMDSLLAYLGVRGVRVHLVHPPFNPIYFDRVQDSPYIEGLRQVEAVTRELAAKHKLGFAGSFDPSELGCTAQMFIDAEHSNAHCLKKLLADIGNSIDLPSAPVVAEAPVENPAKSRRSQQLLLASGWIGSERTLARASVAQPAADVVAPGLRQDAASPEEVASVDAPHPAATQIVTLAPAAAAQAEEAADAPVEKPATATPPVLRERKRSAAPVSDRVMRRTIRRPTAQTRKPSAIASEPHLIWPGDVPVRRQ